MNLSNSEVKINPKRIVIQNKVFTYVKTRDKNRNPSDLYKSKKFYLKIGPKKTIEKEYKIEKKLYKIGYKVPKIISKSNHNSQLFFMEEKVGNKTFEDIFSNEFKKEGKISDKNFKSFLDFVMKYTEIQIKSINKKKDNVDFSKYIDFKRLYSYIPNKQSDLKKYLYKIKLRLKKVPVVFCHGDFHAGNILSEGVIDFEHSTFLPVGFDQVTAISRDLMYPKSFNSKMETNNTYFFSNKQKKYYSTELKKLFEKYKLKKVHYAEYIILRMLWNVDRTEDRPVLRKWRIKKLLIMIDKYLT